MYFQALNSLPGCESLVWFHPIASVWLFCDSLAEDKGFRWKQVLWGPCEDFCPCYDRSLEQLACRKTLVENKCFGWKQVLQGTREDVVRAMTGSLIGHASRCPSCLRVKAWTYGKGLTYRANRVGPLNIYIVLVLSAMCVVGKQVCIDMPGHNITIPQRA